MTNFTLDKNGTLIYAKNNGVLSKWVSTPKATSNYNFTTKDFDFNTPAQRKRIYKVYMSYVIANTGFMSLQYAKDGEPSFTSVGNLPASGGEPQSFSLSIPNVYSIRFKVVNVGGLSAPAHFEINDISVVYRLKSVN